MQPMARDLILDPFSGVAGDMWLGLLVDLGLDPAALEGFLASLDLPRLRVDASRVARGALMAARLQVVVPEDAAVHRGLHEIEVLLAAAGLPGRLTEQALEVFALLAREEGAIHGVPPDRIHFHELGALDTIADVCGTLFGLQELGVERVWSLPVALGSGTVAGDHGLLPIPAPAVAALLAGFPVHTGPGPGEHTTPTGAALLAALARPFPPEAAFVPRRVGYGAGTRDFEGLPNVLRGWLAEVQAPAAQPIWELQVQLDDLTGEAAAYVLERLFAAGATDAWLTQILMKKGRPGLLLSALAEEAVRPALESVILSETQTLGLRRHRVERTRLPRRVESRQTSLGAVRCKVRSLPDGSEEWSVEQEDAARLAREAGLSLGAVLARIQRELPSC